jgi:hypothetical protein
MRDLLVWISILLVACSGNGNPGDDQDASGLEAREDVAGDAADDAGDAADALPRPDYKPVVFAVVSDLHIEGDMEDSGSKKVAALLAEAAARTPTPELIAVTGDLTESMVEPLDTGEGSPLDTLAKLFEQSLVPVEATLGNHDYYTPGDFIYTPVPDSQAREAAFEEMLGVPPWHVSVYGGMKFIFLNSIQGSIWKDSIGLNGSMGQEQLEWLEETLADGTRAVLFLHHPPSIVLEEGESNLESIIEAHADTILAVFVGHIHVWARSEIAGVPIYLTEAGYDGQGLHHVRVDPAAGTVEILNAAAIDYGEVEPDPCDPARPPVVEDLAALAGAILELRVPEAHIEPMGLGTYLTEMVAGVPLVLLLGEPEPTGKTIPALLASGAFYGDGTIVAPPYVKPVAGGACVGLEIAVDGPCIQTSPVTLAVEIGKTLGLPLPPGWRIRAELADMAFSGVLADGPALLQGVMRATLDLNLGLQDVRQILVEEYCAKKLAGCMPGAAGMPVCPAEPGVELFDEIPEYCDVDLLGFGLRTLFSILESVPGYTLQIEANFSTWAGQTAPDPQPGAVAPNLFASESDGGTCPAL